MSIAPGIRSIGIYEENTPQSFQLDGEDVDVESPDINTITRRSGRGTLKKVAESFEYVINHDNESLHSSLDSAAHDTLQWKMVIVGFNSMIFVLDECTFVPEEVPQFDPESENYPYRIRYQVRGGTQIGRGINGLYAYQKSQGNKTFADEDASGEADGFTNSGIETTSFSGGVQTLTDSSGGGSFYIDVPFPFEGINLVLAAEYTVTSGTPDLVLRYLDSADSALASSVTSISASRISAGSDIDSPANTFTARLLLAEDTAAFDITVKEPSLRNDGKTAYVNG